MTSTHAFAGSSMLAAVTHTGTVLTVTFNNGRIYHYEDIPYSTYVEFTTAESAGSYYNQKIKGVFTRINEQEQ